MFNVNRKVGYAINSTFDFIETAVNIRPLSQLQGGCTSTFTCSGGHALDVFHPLQCLFQQDAYRLFSFFRRSTGIGHTDLDGPCFDVGEFFLAGIHERRNACHDKKHHQQIGRHVILDKPGDDGFHGTGLRR